MIEHLIESKAAESDALDFKVDTYKGDRGAQELLKDVTAFANSRGGKIILGVATDDLGRASSCPGIQVESIDAEIERLESICRDCIEPRIGTLTFTDAQCEGNHCIVIDVASSALAPHRIQKSGSKYHRAIYLRRGRSAVEASIHEVRDIVEGSTFVPKLIDKFFEERWDAIRTGRRPNGFPDLVTSMTILISPVRNFGSRDLVDVALHEGDRFLFSPVQDPIQSRPNIFGAIHSDDHDGLTYNQIHYNGCIELFRGGLERTFGEAGDRGRPTIIPAVPLLMTFHDDVGKVLRSAHQFLGPDSFQLRIGFSQILYNLAWDGYGFGSRRVPIEREFLLPDVSLNTDEKGIFDMKAFSRVADLIWRAWGERRCQFFGEDGTPVATLARYLGYESET